MGRKYKKPSSGAGRPHLAPGHEPPLLDEEASEVGADVRAVVRLVELLEVRQALVAGGAVPVLVAVGEDEHAAGLEHARELAGSLDALLRGAEGRDTRWQGFEACVAASCVDLFACVRSVRRKHDAARRSAARLHWKLVEEVHAGHGVEVAVGERHLLHWGHDERRAAGARAAQALPGDDLKAHSQSLWRSGARGQVG